MSHHAQFSNQEPHDRLRHVVRLCTAEIDFDHAGLRIVVRDVQRTEVARLHVLWESTGWFALDVLRTLGAAHRRYRPTPALHALWDQGVVAIRAAVEYL